MPALLSLFAAFFKIGVFGFGGGIAMLPLIFQTVQSFGLMSAEDFADLVAISQVTPGPIAINAATFVGFHYAGIPGSVAATLGVVVPSFAIILIAMRFLDTYKESRVVQGVFTGIRPATIGLIAAAVVFMAETVLITGGTVAAMPVVLFLIAFGLSIGTKISPVLLTVCMAAAGAILCS